MFRQITANNIVLKEYKFLKELAMEAYLLENEDILKLDDKNFSDVSILDAEVALEKGRKNGDGRIDILAKYSNEYLSIVELKIGVIDNQALTQLEEYFEKKEQLLNIGKEEYWSDEEKPKWVGVLVGSSISRELQTKLEDGYKINDEIPVAGMVIKRFRSEKSEIFVTTDTFFKIAYSNKDYSTFKFMSKEYNKGRLVNAVIKEYVENNPEIEFSSLEKIFPHKKVRNNGNCFDTYECAKGIFESTGYKRHYIKPDEIIKLNDETISTSNQWNTTSIKMFIDFVNDNIDGFNIEI